MNNHIPAEDLSAYLDNALPAIALQEAARHLSACAICREQLDGLQQISSALRQQPPVVVSPFFAARLAQRLKAQRERSLLADFVWLGKRLMPALALLLAIMLLWAPFESQNAQLEENDYLSAAGAGSTMSLLAENSSAMTKEEILELVVLSSTSAQE